jgi:hypothetical protein
MSSFFYFIVTTYAGGFLLTLLGATMIIGIWKNSLLDKPTVSDDIIGYVGGFGFMLIGLFVIGAKIYLMYH